MGSTSNGIARSVDEKQKLRHLVYSTKAEQRMVFRASIIWNRTYKALSPEDVARKLGTTTKTVAKWEKRFAEGRLDGLKDLPRSGAPTRFGLEERCQVVAIACGAPADYGLEGQPRWTYDTLTEVVQRQGIPMRRTSVWRTLEQNELKPHRVKMWLHSPDPEFKEKVNGVVDLYLNAPKDRGYPIQSKAKAVA